MILFIKYLILFTLFIIIKRHIMSLFLVRKINKRINAINTIKRLKSNFSECEFSDYIEKHNVIKETDKYITFLNSIEKTNTTYISKLILNHADFYNKKNEFIKLSATFCN